MSEQCCSKGEISKGHLRKVDSLVTSRDISLKKFCCLTFDFTPPDYLIY